MSRRTIVPPIIIIAVLLLVVAGTIVLPRLTTPKIGVTDSSAVGYLRAIAGAQVIFHEASGRYATRFEELTDAKPAFLDGIWEDDGKRGCVKQGYVFTLHGGETGFTATASPTKKTKRRYRHFRHFFIDETCIIRCSHDGPASAESPPVE